MAMRACSFQTPKRSGTGNCGRNSWPRLGSSSGSCSPSVSDSGCWLRGWLGSWLGCCRSAESNAAQGGGIFCLRSSIAHPPGRRWFQNKYITEDRPMAVDRDALRDWHRLFGLLTDFFTDSPFTVEVERDLSEQQQFLDVVVLRRGRGRMVVRLPDGLEDLLAHNLIT